MRKTIMLQDGEQTKLVLLQITDAEESQEYKVVETAIRFARMWGIMETLEERDVFTKQEFGNHINHLILWAEEFIEKEETDLVEFFKKKIESYV